MAAERTIAKYPPLASLLKAMGLLYLALTVVVMLVLLLRERSDLLSPSDGVFFWMMLGIVVAMVILVLWMFAIAARIISLWLLPGKGIYAGESSMRFVVPRVKRWWSPLLELDRKEVPLGDLKGTRLTVSDRAALVIDAGPTIIEIPQGVFGVPNFALEERIRAATNGGLPAIPPEKVWAASVTARVCMVLMGVLLPSASIALVFALAQNSDPESVETMSKLASPFVIAGIAMFCLSAVHRGRVVLDARGVIYERGSKASFVSWESLVNGSVQRYTRPRALWLWTDLTIQTASGLFKRPESRIMLTRIIWMGFPLKEIEALIYERLHKIKTDAPRPPQP